MPIPYREIGPMMVDSMVADLERQYGHPVDRGDATKLLFATFGGILAKAEEEHEAELSRLIEKLEQDHG